MLRVALGSMIDYDNRICFFVYKCTGRFILLEYTSERFQMGKMFFQMGKMFPEVIVRVLGIRDVLVATGYKFFITLINMAYISDS
jgi:hypothetical protein